MNPAPYVVVATPTPPPARWNASAMVTVADSCRAEVKGKPRSVRELTRWALPLPISPNRWSARSAITSATAVETVRGAWSGVGAGAMPSTGAVAVTAVSGVVSGAAGDSGMLRWWWSGVQEGK